MQVTETLSDGLKREFKVVVPAAELEAKVNTRLDDLKGRIRINGFRPGKVPVAHLKRVYGKAVMAETIDEAVREANASIVTDHGFKLAMEPKVTWPEGEEEVKSMVEALNRIAEQNRPFQPKGEGAKAEAGDKVTISFKGTIDGKPFEGGSGED